MSQAEKFALINRKGLRKAETEQKKMDWLLQSQSEGDFLLMPTKTGLSGGLNIFSLSPDGS